MTSDQILVLVRTALLNKTDAGAKVFTPGGIPTWDGDLPVLLLYCDDEQGQSISGTVGYPQFDVVATVKVLGRVAVGATNDDAGTAIVSTALGRLRDQIKAAVINGPAMMAPLGPVQAFRWFRATKDYSDADTAKHTGQITVEIGVEHYQGADDFYVDDGDTLSQVVVRAGPDDAVLTSDDDVPLTDDAGTDVLTAEPGPPRVGLDITSLDS